LKYFYVAAAAAFLDSGVFSRMAMAVYKSGLGVSIRPSVVPDPNCQ
jgi:hypothetical protein